MDFLHLLEHHLLDHRIVELFTLGAVRFALSKHVLMMLLAAVILLMTLPWLARRWTLVPSGARNLLESLVVFLRDQVILPNTGEAGRPYLPYFFTLFFFILVVNLLGNIPGLATATANISVTASLALCTVVLINVAGVREHGFVHHVQNFVPHGVPWWLIPIVFPLEVMGLFTRAFALTIRLFANMTAGHIVILAFLALIFFLKTWAVVPASLVFAFSILCLEVFVCFLQAYIFTLLSSIFVGASLNPH